MNKKINNTITISFKQDEVEYLNKFKDMYAVPTAIIKDFIINTVKNNYDTQVKPIPINTDNVNVGVSDINSDPNPNTISGLDLLDF